MQHTHQSRMEELVGTKKSCLVLSDLGNKSSYFLFLAALERESV